jgi:predicted HTH transcriptional regulator
LRKEIIKHTILGFINRAGGRIYIGITDELRVVGVTLTGKEKDELRMYF